MDKNTSEYKENYPEMYFSADIEFQEKKYLILQEFRQRKMLTYKIEIMFILEFSSVSLTPWGQQKNVYTGTSWESSQVLPFRCHSNRKSPLSSNTRVL